jgi:hypothetical protein
VKFPYLVEDNKVMIRINLLRNATSYQGGEVARPGGAPVPSIIHSPEKQQVLKDLFGPKGPLHHLLFMEYQENGTASLSDGTVKDAESKMQVIVHDSYPETFTFELVGITFSPVRISDLEPFKANLTFQRKPGGYGGLKFDLASSSEKRLTIDPLSVHGLTFAFMDLGSGKEPRVPFKFEGAYQKESYLHIRVASETLPVADLYHGLESIMGMGQSHLTERERTAVENFLAEYYSKIYPQFHITGHIYGQDYTYEPGVDIFQVVIDAGAAAGRIRKTIDTASISELHSLMHSNFIEDYLAGIIGILKRGTGESREAVQNELRSLTSGPSTPKNDDGWEF